MQNILTGGSADLSQPLPEQTWNQIAPLLDGAMETLGRKDHDALVLRFFENKNFAEVGAALGTGADTARMRVNRALEKLRKFFTKRGVTLSSVAIAGTVSANSVQAAPVGLAAKITAAVTTIAGTAVTTTIVMTTLQKIAVTAALTVSVGVGIYQAKEAAKARTEVQTLQQQQAPLDEQIQQLQNERDKATNIIANLQEELAKNDKNNLELLKLRGQIGVLQSQLANGGADKDKIEQPPLLSALEYCRRAERHSADHEYEAALEDFNKAIELDPNMDEAYYERGNLYASDLPNQRGGAEKAVADYTRCLEINPNSTARWNRATYYPSLGKYDQAIADWTTYIEGDTDFSHQLEGKTKSIAGAYFWRGHVYQTYKHDYTNAIADYTAAIEMNPKIEDAHRLRGKCYESLGDTEKAQQDFAIEPKSN